MDRVESSVMHNSLDHNWRPTRLGKQLRGRHTRQTPLMSVSLFGSVLRLTEVCVSLNLSDCFLPVQHNMKHVAEPLIRRNIPHYPTELPKLNMVAPTPQISFPVSTFSGFTNLSHLPPIASKKCQSRLAKVTSQEGCTEIQHLNLKREYFTFPNLKHGNKVTVNTKVYLLPFSWKSLKGLAYQEKRVCRVESLKGGVCRNYLKN